MDRPGRMDGASMNTKPTAISAAAMGRTLVILATSCAAFQGGADHAPSRRLAMTSPHHRSAVVGDANAIDRRGPRSRSRTGSRTVLQYRRGDDDQPMDMQLANDRAVARHHVASTSIIDTNGRQQDDMDEYIEYLERRYSRIHGTRESNNARPRVLLDLELPRKIFMATLSMHTPRVPQVVTSAPSPSSTCSREGDGSTLKILGLTSLASARLRQRLHAPPSTAVTSRVGTTSPSSSQAACIRTSTQSKTLIPTIPTIQRVVNTASSSLRIITNFISLRIIPELLERGTGLSLASFAILLLVRPLLRGALFRQG